MVGGGGGRRIVYMSTSVCVGGVVKICMMITILIASESMREFLCNDLRVSWYTSVRYLVCRTVLSYMRVHVFLRV